MDCLRLFFELSSNILQVFEVRTYEDLLRLKIVSEYKSKKAASIAFKEDVKISEKIKSDSPIHWVRGISDQLLRHWSIDLVSMGW